MTDSVVVPAISAGSSVTAIRSLGRRGVRTIAVGESASIPSLRSAYCDEAHVVPSPYEDLAGYRDALLELCRRPDVVTVMPLQEADAYVLGKHRETFAEHVATPWMPFDPLRGVQDWIRLRETALEAGIDIPETRPLDEWDGWDQPAVIKPRYSIVERDDGLASMGVLFVEAGDPPDVDAIVDEMGHVPIVQEYVPGDGECGFFGLYDAGNPVATFQHRRIRSYNYSGGASAYRESVDVPALREAGDRILTTLDWHGPAMAEFKRDPRDGSVKLIEINPRFWGSLALAVHAGVDFPYLYYRLARGDAIDPVLDYEVGVGCHVFRGEVSYVHSLLRDHYDVVERPAIGTALASLLVSMARQPRFDFLSVDDPMPFVADILGVLKSDLVEPLLAGERSEEVEAYLDTV